MMKESSSGLVIIPIIVNCRLTIYPSDLLKQCMILNLVLFLRRI